MIDPGRPAPRDLWSLVLAAGGSRRLGTPKQLLRIGGQPLISRTLRAAEAVTPDRVVVVLGAHALKLRLLINRDHPDVYRIDNPSWAEGMAGSLRLGLAALPERAAAALLLLTDQPGVDARSLRRLVNAWRRRPARAAASEYGGLLGVPAVLPRALWTEAKNLDGDVGARSLLREGDTVATIVPMPEASFDVDTEKDLRRLRRKTRG